MKHTPEPWKIQTTDFGYTTIFDDEGLTICSTSTRLPDFERIVECVNAMEGVDDPKDLRETYEALNDAVAGVLKEIGHGYDLAPGSALFNKLQNLIK